MVAGFGLVIVDILTMLDEHIVLNGKNPFKHQIIQMGGVMPTTLSLLSHLGIDCQINAALAEDYFADMLVNIFEREHISQGTVLKIPGEVTPMSIVIVDSYSGERTIFYNTGFFPSITADKFDQPLLIGTKLLIADMHNAPATLAFIKKAHDIGARAVIDMGNPKEGRDEIIGAADVIVVPQTYWKKLWPEKEPMEIAKDLLAHGPQIVVLTMGERGSVIATKAEIFHQPAFLVHAVDTNGAGDIFMASFSYGLIQGWDMHHCALFASASSAVAVQKVGKDKKVQTSVEEIERFLSTHQH